MDFAKFTSQDGSRTRFVNLTFGRVGFGKVGVGIAILFCWFGSLSADEPKRVDFERHVAPLLGRLGCNAAACHGAFGGKGGLQFSLFGYSPKMDFESLADRIDTEDPDYSLLLLKPSGQEPHEGGVKYEVDSPTYRLLRQWVAEGAKWKAGSGKVRRLKVEPPQIDFPDWNSKRSELFQELKVLAEFDDGTVEDVTYLAQFSSRDEGLVIVTAEGRVTPQRNGDTSIVVAYGNEYAAVNVLVPFSASATPSVYVELNSLDRPINEKLKRLNLAVSPQASDEEFLRRLTLDTIGTLPTPDEVTQFCSNDDPAKRAKKIDQLLSDPRHAKLWATRMCDITQCDVNQMDGQPELRRKLAQMWHAWFEKRFHENVSYDKMVRSIIGATSRGEQSVTDWMEQEAARIRGKVEDSETSYAGRNEFDLFYRRVDERGQFPVEEVAELAAAGFTGIRINCARCHKHPFDRWSQNDYASFANIFSKVVYGSSTELNVAIFDELDRRREAKKQGVEMESLPQLREVFNNSQFGKKVVGSDGDVNVSPRVLNGSRLSADRDPRLQLADWLTSKDNPYFAKNLVNRVWANYFGVGIVNPVDDFSISNPASHPELLNELADHFIQSGFDIRVLEKKILTSAAYQRTSTPILNNTQDRKNFARQYVRPILAEVVLDSINQVLGVEESFPDGIPAGSLAIEVASNDLGGEAGKALRVFGRGERESICDCDRTVEPNLRQSLYLMNNSSLLGKIQSGSIRELLQKDDRQLVDELFLRMFSRWPQEKELTVALEHLKRASSREAGFDDLVWGLLNTREFVTNH